MSRPLKPLQVERMFVQKHHVAVELFLDRNSKLFFADVDLKRLEAPSLEQLKTKVKVAVDSSAAVVWERVIELTCSNRPDFHHGGTHAPMEHHSIEVEYRRIEIGKTADGRTLQRPLTEDLDEEYRRSRQVAEPLAYAHQDYGDGSTRLPYSDATWAAIKAVAAAIDTAHAKVSELFDVKDGGKKLLAMSGIALLGAGTVDAPPARRTKGGR